MATDESPQSSRQSSGGRRQPEIVFRSHGSDGVFARLDGTLSALGVAHETDVSAVSRSRQSTGRLGIQYVPSHAETLLPDCTSSMRAFDSGLLAQGAVRPCGGRSHSHLRPEATDGTLVTGDTSLPPGPQDSHGSDMLLAQTESLGAQEPHPSTLLEPLMSPSVPDASFDDDSAYAGAGYDGAATSGQAMLSALTLESAVRQGSMATRSPSKPASATMTMPLLEPLGRAGSDCSESLPPTPPAFSSDGDSPRRCMIHKVRTEVRSAIDRIRVYQQQQQQQPPVPAPDALAPPPLAPPPMPVAPHSLVAPESSCATLREAGDDMLSCMSAGTQEEAEVEVEGMPSAVTAEEETAAAQESAAAPAAEVEEVKDEEEEKGMSAAPASSGGVMAALSRMVSIVFGGGKTDEGGAAQEEINENLAPPAPQPAAPAPVAEAQAVEAEATTTSGHVATVRHVYEDKPPSTPTAPSVCSPVRVGVLTPSADVPDALPEGKAEVGDVAGWLEALGDDGQTLDPQVVKGLGRLLRAAAGEARSSEEREAVLAGLKAIQSSQRRQEEGLEQLALAVTPRRAGEDAAAAPQGEALASPSRHASQCSSPPAAPLARTATALTTPPVEQHTPRQEQYVPPGHRPHPSVPGRFLPATTPSRNSDTSPPRNLSPRLLPPTTGVYYTPSGRGYYYDDATGKSTWLAKHRAPPPQDLTLHIVLTKDSGAA